MQKQSFSQDEILAILSGPHPDPDRRQAVLKFLFGDSALRKACIAHVRRHGGNRQDGEDVFQEAIILFDRKLRFGAFRGDGALSAYFMGIVRWHWFNECQRTYGRLIVLAGEAAPGPPAGNNPEIDYLLAERRGQLESLLAQLNDKCRHLLKLFQLDYSMDEIARLTGYANSGVAKKEVFLCRQRFRVLLERHPEVWNDLYTNKKS